MSDLNQANGWSHSFDVDSIPSDIREIIHENCDKERKAYRRLLEEYKAHLHDKIRRLEIELQGVGTNKELASYPKPERVVYPHYQPCDMGR